MSNKQFIYGLLVFAIIICSFAFKSQQEKEIIWKLNSTSEIGGNPVTPIGDPRLITNERNSALEFNGKNDGLLIENNPLLGMEEFTIEVEIKPYKGFPENREQRFLHIQDPEDESRRILLELRLNENNEWYGDWFLKAGEESITLIDSSFTHPVGEWATIGLAYRDGGVRGYVNGKQEVTGKINFLPIGSGGRTSVGTRMDQRSWFKGLIKEIRFQGDNSGKE